MYRPGRFGVYKRLDCSGDPPPSCGAVRIALSLQLISAGCALLERFVSVAAEHEGCGAPDVDYFFKKSGSMKGYWLSNYRINY
jgi:hypothetical protein